MNCFACVPKQFSYSAAIICCLRMFLRVEAMFLGVKFDLSDALTLRDVKFWLSNLLFEC